MKRIKLFVTAVLVLVSTLAMAQNQVTGVVTDAGTGEALAGAAVQVKGTMTGASAGADGSYSVKVANPQDAVLIFSFFSHFSSLRYSVSIRNPHGRSSALSCPRRCRCSRR